MSTLAYVRLVKLGGLTPLFNEIENLQRNDGRRFLGIEISHVVGSVRSG